VRLERIARRAATGTWGRPATREELDGFLRAADEMRTRMSGACLHVDTSRLDVGEVAARVDAWMADLRRARGRS
jgi:hypothetical protein